MFIQYLKMYAKYKKYSNRWYGTDFGPRMHRTEKEAAHMFDKY